MTPAAIDAGRMDSMSVLDSHRANSLADRIGSVVPGSLKIARGQASCTIRLSRSEKAELLLQDLADGHSLPISVGYRIHQEERTEAKAGGVAVIRATKWEPLEISVVPIPADAGAKTRDLENEGNDSMTDTTKLTRAEKQRQHDIRALAKSSGLTADHELIARAVDDDMSIDQFRAALLDHLIAKEEESPTFPIVETRGMRDAQGTFRTLAANAMLHRNGLTPKLEEGANEFRDMTLVDLAREVLQVRGHNHRGPASDVVRRALHSTSDFPHILGDITRQTMMQTYSGLQNTYQLIATRNVVPDLREVKVIDLGNGPSLEPLTEKGEYTRGTANESSEAFTMGHYGRVIGLTEAMIINDQLGAFARLVQTWAIAAGRLEGNIAWAPILKNAKLKSDNKALFH
ncbi:MAG: HK97 family phage prohead protease, partial [Alphaproteobacteria bacterium]|nr:HK97 family phage prohead protease [Alphaproteobacteria bacterium]